MRDRMSIIALAVAGTLALSAPALAQTSSPTQDAYGGVIAEVVTPSQPEQQQPQQPRQEVAAETAAPAPTAAAQPQAEEGSLPFTGLQATLVALAGIALLGVGLVLRRTTRTDS
jgi:Tfp pilus assembly protein FimV